MTLQNQESPPRQKEPLTERPGLHWSYPKTVWDTPERGRFVFLTGFTVKTENHCPQTATAASPVMPLSVWKWGGFTSSRKGLQSLGSASELW